MASFGKFLTERRQRDLRRLTGAVCPAAFVLLIFFWEPFGGSLGSPWWTALMILNLLVFSGVRCALDIIGQMRTGLGGSPLSYRTVAKIIITLLLVFLLILMGRHAAKEKRMIEEGWSGAPVTQEEAEMPVYDYPGQEIPEEEYPEP